MKIVSSGTVESTWRELTELSVKDGSRLQEEFLQRQEPLAQFIQIMGEESMSSDAHGLATYVTLNLWQMFERASPTPLSPASPDEIMDAFENRERWVESFLGAEEEEIERWLRITSEMPQEHVTRYLIELLMEDRRDPDSAVTLTEEDVGELFLVLLAVIDVLDAKLQEAT